MPNVKTLYIVRFNTGKYWGGMRSFVRNWYQAHMYSTAKIASTMAKQVISRRRTWYDNLELESFEVIQVNMSLEDVVLGSKLDLKTNKSGLVRYKFIDN